jgi:uncharacterized protein YydD (DUF2326 family)
MMIKELNKLNTIDTRINTLRNELIEILGRINRSLTNNRQSVVSSDYMLLRVQYKEKLDAVADLKLERLHLLKSA